MHLFKREQNSELFNIRASFIRIVILLVAVLQFLKYKYKQPSTTVPPQLITKFSLFILTITILLLWGNIFHLVLKQKTLFFWFYFSLVFVNSFLF